MSNRFNHCILRQYLEIDFRGSESAGLALQRVLPALCASSLGPAIEAALDRCTPEHGTLRFDRLDLDAGEIDLAHLDAQLADAVANALEETVLASLIHWPENMRQGSRTDDDDATAVMVRRTPRQSADETLAWFLSWGSLPATLRLEGGEALESFLLARWNEAGECGPDQGLDTILTRALSQHKARQRLVHHFSPVFLARLLARGSSAMAIHMDALLPRIQDIYTDMAGGRPLAGPIRRALWESAFDALARGASIALLDALLLRAFIDEPRPEVIATLKHMLQPPEPESGAAEPLPPQAWTPSDAAVPTGLPADEHPDEHTGLYIDNAGLVLLHPFLESLFHGLGLLKDGKLGDPSQAMAVLHYLATGRSDAPEYEWPLLKLICGQPLDAPLTCVTELGRVERDEADALLRAVVGHWSALKGASIEALRETFFVRPGKLSRRNGDWLLQVESRTVDVLLSQLPWGYAIIKLPWMHCMLWVEWG